MVRKKKLKSKSEKRELRDTRQRAGNLTVSLLTLDISPLFQQKSPYNK